MISKIKKWWLYREHLASVALLFGFILDNLTLRRIDLPFETFVLFLYLSVAGVSLFLLNGWVERFPANWWGVSRLKLFLLFTMQVAFGALFSAFFVFYSRSADLISSWPFLVFLIGLLIGNETLKKKYDQFVFQVSVFFIVLFTFSIFYIPIIFKQIGDRFFILSGLVSLLIIFVFIYLLSFISPLKIKDHWPRLIKSIGFLFVVINLMYFTNLIPPIPLALKDIGVYYHLRRDDGGKYVAERENKPWYQFNFRDRYYITDGSGRAYMFTAIFAPTDLKTSIIHEWEYYDEVIDEWRLSSRVEFPILGGRGEGYRGYSIKENIFPGDWRVTIKTLTGQVIGRERFVVKKRANLPELEMVSF